MGTHATFWCGDPFHLRFHLFVLGCLGPLKSKQNNNSTTLTQIRYSRLHSQIDHLEHQWILKPIPDGTYNPSLPNSENFIIQFMSDFAAKLLRVGSRDMLHESAMRIILLKSLRSHRAQCVFGILRDAYGFRKH